MGNKAGTQTQVFDSASQASASTSQFLLSKYVYITWNGQ